MRAIAAHVATATRRGLEEVLEQEQQGRQNDGSDLARRGGAGGSLGTTMVVPGAGGTASEQSAR